MQPLGTPDRGFLTVYQGEDRTFNLSIISRVSGVERPYVLNNPDEIEVRFPKSDGTFISKKMSMAQVVIVSDPGGQISVIMSDADTALLNVGARQSFFVYFTKSGIVRIVQYQQALTVITPPF